MLTRSSSNVRTCQGGGSGALLGSLSAGVASPCRGAPRPGSRAPRPGHPHGPGPGSVAPRRPPAPQNDPGHAAHTWPAAADLSSRHFDSGHCIRMLSSPRCIFNELYLRLVMTQARPHFHEQSRTCCTHLARSRKPVPQAFHLRGLHAHLIAAQLASCHSPDAYTFQ